MLQQEQRSGGAGGHLFIYYGAAPLLPIPQPEGSHQVRSKQAPCWDEAQGAACPNPPASTSLVGGRCSSGFEPHHPPGDAVPSSEPSPSCLPSTSFIKHTQARAEYSTINTLPGCFPRPAPPHTNPAVRYPSTHCQAIIYLLHEQQELPAPLATQQLSWPHNNLLFSAP